MSEVQDNASTKKEIDWEAVEIQYRAGIRSLKDIGAEFGVSDAGILKRAKRDGWERDLKAKIQAKADAKVSAALVSKEVSEAKTLTENIVVEANASAVAAVRLAHRAHIKRGQDMTLKLLAELEGMTDEVAFNVRVESNKKLSETMKTYVGMEREAYGINSDTAGDNEGSNPARGTVFKVIRAS